MLFLRIFQHLLPTGQAWRTTVEKTLRRFFEGLSGFGPDVKDFADLVFLDALPSTTRELPEWQKQFALESTGVEETDRLVLDATWKAQGGQSPSYIQSVLHAAGFTMLFVHEWAEPGGPPYVARDPRPYINQPLIGSFQCATHSAQPQCFDGPEAPYCNAFLANDTHYLVNQDLTPRPPPPMSDDETQWRYTFYVGGETFPDLAEVPIARRADLERLLLKIRPAQQWIVELITWTGVVEIFDDTFSDEFN